MPANVTKANVTLPIRTPTEVQLIAENGVGQSKHVSKLVKPPLYYHSGRSAGHFETLLVERKLIIYSCELPIKERQYSSRVQGFGGKLKGRPMKTYSSCIQQDLLLAVVERVAVASPCMKVI